MIQNMSLTHFVKDRVGIVNRNFQVGMPQFVINKLVFVDANPQQIFAGKAADEDATHAIGWADAGSSSKFTRISKSLLARC